MKNKTFLVTGAAGFIGAAVAKTLIQHGHKVITIDNLSTGFEENIPQGVEFLQGDFQDAAVIKKLSSFSIDAIFHIAGQSSGEISFENPVYDLQTNTQSTLMLLKYCQQAGCNRFIYASTMSVYGDVPDKPIDENTTPVPKSFYGVGKLASEHYLRIYSQFGITCTALRLFNVYGPGQNLHNMKQGMVSIFLAQALRDNRVVVKGDKLRFRDFIYIDDVVNVFVEIEKSGHPSLYEVINVCSGNRTTIEQLLGQLNQYFDNTLDIQFVGSTPGDQFGIYGSNKKLTTDFRIPMNTSLEDGLKKMVAWGRHLPLRS